MLRNAKISKHPFDAIIISITEITHVTFVEEYACIKFKYVGNLYEK